MSAQAPSELLQRAIALGAVAAEVFWKEGRSARLRSLGAGGYEESLLEETGVAIRAWGRAGGMGFVTFVPGEANATIRALEGLRKALQAEGEGPPGLPAEPPREGAAGEREPASPRKEGAWRELADRMRAALPGIAERFGRPGLEALRFEGAWCEAGWSRVHLVNSAGFDGEREMTAWHAALAARSSGGQGGDQPHVGYLATAGNGSDEPDLEALLTETAWRTAASAGGGAAPPGRTHILLDEALASRLLAGAGGRLTAGEDTLPMLEREEKVGPAELAIEEVPDPAEPWDGEGMPRGRVSLVSRGRLVGLLTDLSSSRRFGLPPTGSARRLSFRDLPQAGASGLVLTWEGRATEAARLLERLDAGLYMTGGRVLTSDSGSAGAVIGGGIWIEGGRAVRPVGRALLRGGPFRLLAAIEGASAPTPGLTTEGARTGSLLLSGELAEF